jgi:hypothetical protein
MNTNFIIYLIAYALIIAGVWFGLNAAGVPQTWIIVAVMILVGLGILFAWSRAQTDTAQREHARGGTQTGGTQTGTAQGGGNAPQQGGGDNPQQGNAPQQGGGQTQQGGQQQRGNPPA